MYFVESSNGKKEVIAKAAGYLAISGIAISILKSINPFEKPKPIFKEPIQKFNSVSLAEPIIEKPIASFDAELPMGKTVDVVKGDTLLSLSQKYGVSVEAIKEANELIGDTIYPGKKFVRSTKCNWSC
ncbi:LysM domain-containing protein [Heracleum sosnowskyi]|uniref:LysM domain-containing protein n=1 Tax=Heracleum sosnowskyi TaxID=360622 RepID=A0AAD8J4P8_9APIA|nr:LysM domain-containing protein [Heracleum sosnowskyi]